MRFLQYLHEEYEASIRWGDQSLPIFVNPDSSEMRQASRVHRTIRWILDMDRKKLYVWDGYYLEHMDVIRRGLQNLKAHLRGESIFQGGKLSSSIFTPHNIDTTEIVKHQGSLRAAVAWMKDNKQWLSRYFHPADIEGAYMPL